MCVCALLALSKNKDTQILSRRGKAPRPTSVGHCNPFLPTPSTPTPYDSLLPPTGGNCQPAQTTLRNQPTQRDTACPERLKTTPGQELPPSAPRRRKRQPATTSVQAWRAAWGAWGLGQEQGPAQSLGKLHAHGPQAGHWPQDSKEGHGRARVEGPARTFFIAHSRGSSRVGPFASFAHSGLLGEEGGERREGFSQDSRSNQTDPLDWLQREKDGEKGDGRCGTLGKPWGVRGITAKGLVTGICLQG